MIASHQALAEIYHRLAGFGASCVDPLPAAKLPEESLDQVFCRACECSRFDPRLLEILVQFVCEHFEKLNPTSLRQIAQTLRTPQAVAVVLELACSVFSSELVKDAKNYITKNITPVEQQLYYVGVYGKPFSKNMIKAIEEPLHEFLIWGFWANEKPIIRQNQNRIGAGNLSLTARRNVIRKLSESQEKFSIADFLAAVDNSISRQQAFLDLKNSGLVKPSGKGRGVRWGKS